MEIIKYNQKNHITVIEKAVKTLKNGGLVVYPTETCYGLGANATNDKAIEKLYKYKRRREGKPLSIAVFDAIMAKKYVFINEIAQNLYDHYLPGPITVVSQGRGKVGRGVESEYGTLGIRIPDNQLALDIIRELNKPMTATSANPSYLPKPYSIKKLLEMMPEKSKNIVDLIIDAGELEKRETSTVVDTTLNNLNIMRQGQIDFSKQISNKKAILNAQTTTAEEMLNFGALNMLKYIDEALDRPLVFFLMGELGVGKTQFSKGVAKKLNIKDIVKSPSFTLLNEYNYKLGERKGKFVHIDTWRLENLKDLETIGLDSYLKKGNIIAIEWADKFLSPIKEKIKEYNGKIISVSFKYLDEYSRRVETYE